jgi:hypothetical protein
VRFASFEEMENALRARLEALRRRAELLHVLMVPDFDRADQIGEFWGYPQSRAFAELLIDCEGGPDLAGSARRDSAECCLTEGPLETSSLPGLAFDGPH